MGQYCSKLSGRAEVGQQNLATDQLRPQEDFLGAIEVGQRVRLHGLCIPLLDGQEGICQQLASERCFVQLDRDLGRDIFCREVHYRHVAPVSPSRDDDMGSTALVPGMYVDYLVHDAKGQLVACKPAKLHSQHAAHCTVSVFEGTPSKMVNVCIEIARIREMSTTIYQAVARATRQWQVQLDDGWQPMEEAVALQIFKAMHSNTPAFRYTAGRGDALFEYEIDLLKFKQTNLRTKKQRSIQLSEALPPPSLPENFSVESARPSTTRDLNFPLSCSDTILHYLFRWEAVRVVSGRWLLQRRGERLPRRQDLPADAFINVSAICGGSIHLVAVSYGWIKQGQPDPENFHLATIQQLVHQAISKFEVVDLGLFWDFVSLEQIWGPVGQVVGRTHDADKRFKGVLNNMHVIYGHKYIMVWRLENLPAGATPIQERGWPFFEQCVFAAVDKAYLTWTVVDPQNVDERVLQREGLHMQPRVNPARFNAMLAERQFTGRGDYDDLVKLFFSLYESCLCKTMRQHIHVVEQDWKQLGMTLRDYTMLNEISFVGGTSHSAPIDSNAALTQFIVGLGDTCLPCLRILDLEACEITSDMMHGLGLLLARCPALDVLRVGWNPGAARGLPQFVVGLGNVSLPCFRSLYLSKCKITVDTMHDLGLLLARCPALERLILDGNPGAARGLPKLVVGLGDASLPCLQTLSLSECGDTMHGLGLLLARCPALAHLDLDGSPGVARCLPHFGVGLGDAPLPCLQSLALRRCKIAVDTMHDLGLLLARCPALAHLDLAGNPGLARGLPQLLVGLGDISWPRLWMLDLSKCQITVDTMHDLGLLLARCSALGQLELDENPGVVRALPKLIVGLGDASWPCLHTLSLTRCKITSDTMHGLGLLLARCPALEKLELDENPGAARGLPAFVVGLGDASFHCLRTLNLGGCETTSDTMHGLGLLLARCPALEKLELDGNPALESLCKARFPSVRVT